MRVLADEKRVAGLIESLAAMIKRDMAGPEQTSSWALIGIRSRGDVLAKRLAAKLRPDHVGTVDITLYRDDLSEVSAQPVVRETEIPFAIDGLNIVLVDDVLMTGRSVRAALQSLMDLGRPKRVWLSVLVDRGGRELPIAADHVGLRLGATSEGRKTEGDEVGVGERVEVNLTPTDDEDRIIARSSGGKRGGQR